jgi:hypothetical protein
MVFRVKSHMALADDLVSHVPQKRRSLLVLVAIATVASLFVQLASAQSTCPPDLNDADILNFALNLEYLEVCPLPHLPLSAAVAVPTLCLHCLIQYGSSTVCTLVVSIPVSRNQHCHLGAFNTLSSFMW